MKQIELVTTQNVMIEYPSATAFERAIATILDIFVVGLLSWFFIYTFFELFEAFDVDRFYGRFLSYLPFLLMILYYFSTEYWANGQTIGKKALGTRVIRLDGQKAGSREAIIRATLLMVDLVFSSGILGLIFIISGRHRQRLGDMAANTVVIKSNPPIPFKLSDILKIKSKDQYEPKYEQVTVFTESDMLIIKKALKQYQKYPNQAHREALVAVITKLKTMMELEELPGDKIEFIKTVIRDYIVLTR